MILVKEVENNIRQKKVLLKDVAYDKIKKKILFENVKHMSENSLVEDLNMSRTPIREALFKLQHEGFLQIISNQGIVVKDRKSTRLNSSHVAISYAVFCLKK